MKNPKMYIKTLENGTWVFVAGCTICNLPPKDNKGDFIGRCESCTDKAGK
jgi:hypothetical protein